MHQKIFIFFLHYFLIYIKYMSVLRKNTRRPCGPFFKGNVDTRGYVDENTNISTKEIERSK